MPPGMYCIIRLSVSAFSLQVPSILSILLVYCTQCRRRQERWPNMCQKIINNSSAFGSFFSYCTYMNNRTYCSINECKCNNLYITVQDSRIIYKSYKRSMQLSKNTHLYVLYIVFVSSITHRFVAKNMRNVSASTYIILYLSLASLFLPSLSLLLRIYMSVGFLLINLHHLSCRQSWQSWPDPPLVSVPLLSYSLALSSLYIAYTLCRLNFILFQNLCMIPKENDRYWQKCYMNPKNFLKTWIRV